MARDARASDTGSVSEVSGGSPSADPAPPPKLRWGGRREGAGRKPNGLHAGVSHAPRPRIGPRSEALVTLVFLPGLPDLRRRAPAQLLAQALEAAEGRFGMRILEHALRRDHLHLIVRARSGRAFSRGMLALCVRASRGLNRLWGRSGSVFADRYEVRVLASEEERLGARQAPCDWRNEPGPSRPARCSQPKRGRGSRGQ